MTRTGLFFMGCETHGVSNGFEICDDKDKKLENPLLILELNTARGGDQEACGKRMAVDAFQQAWRQAS